MPLIRSYSNPNVPLRLPILKLFYNPSAAFRGLAENPPASEAFVFFLINVSVVSFLVLADFITPPQRHALAKGVQLLWHSTHASLAVARYYSFLTIPYFVGITTLSSLVLYSCVRMLGSTLPFKTFWTGTIFVYSPFIVLQYLAEPVPHHQWALVTGSAIMTIWMVRVLCGFSTGRAIGAYLLTLVVSAGVFTILLVGGLFSLYGNGKFMQRFLRPPALTPINIPADYSWAAQALDGQPVKMDALRGKVVVLNFWATWCGPCRSEMPSLERLYNRVKDQGIVVMAISEEKVDTVASFVKDKHYTFPILVRYERMPLFESKAVPVTFILSPDGVIVSRHEGAAEWDSPEIMAYLKSLKTKTHRQPEGGALNLGLNDRDTAQVLNNQAVKLIRRRQYAEAEDFYQRALKILEKEPKPENTDVISEVQEGLGYIAYKRGQFAKAEKLFLKAIHLEEGMQRPNDPLLATDYTNLANLYRKMQRTADAARADAQSKALQVK